ncbi:unnamed protein product [Amoebophrya sp. A25]|nr:unnamed protein product [Amoebophrya sp. A25]|eukprot:GSA25T00013934001.1
MTSDTQTASSWIQMKGDGASEGDVLDQVRKGMKQIKVPTAGNKVYKDECVFTFDNPYSPTGVFVNLSTWQCVGERFLPIDSGRSSDNILYLKLRYTKVYKSEAEKDEEQVTTLGIGVAGGFAAQDFELKKQYFLAVFDTAKKAVVAELAYPFPADADIPMLIAQCCEAVEKHAGAAAMESSSVWEDKDELKPSKYASDLVQLPVGDKRISPDPSTWKCEKHGTTDNLWLNLSDGYIGGGRKNWDGSGGSGGALEHFEEEKAKGNFFPLAVKLGTITPQGADVFSYSPDENDLVIDPKLGEHLAHWGIDIMKQEKTAKTMAELTVELNANYDWGKVCESGSSLERVYGPGHVGFANLGNTCYMNSSLQLLLSLPEVLQRYCEPAGTSAPLRLSAAPANTLPSDLVAQMAKVATATNVPGELEQSRFPRKAEDPNDESNVIAPRMFRSAAVENTSDFSTNKQQDAEEFMRYLFTRLASAEKAALQKGRIQPITAGSSASASCSGSSTTSATEDLFMFKKEERYEATTGEVAYLDGSDCFLPLMINMEDAVVTPPPGGDAADAQVLKKQKTENGEKSPEDSSAKKEEEAIPEIPFDRALSRVFEPEDMGSEHLFRGRRAVKSTALATMPRYLLVQVQRYYVDPATWSHKKRECTCPVPEKLDLERYRAPARGEDGKCRPGEKLMPDDSAGGGSSSSPEPSPEIVQNLMVMGFGENGCKRAALATQNRGVEEASEWIFAHMEDSDFNDPLPEGGAAAGGGDSGGVDAESVALLNAITGFAEKHCKRALKATNNNPDMAAAWLMERSPEDLEALEASEAAGAGGGSSAASFTDGPGMYSLVGFISHVGRATSSGHYVAHIKKKGQWCLFDDEKVAKSEKTPFEYGYVYCFRRDD